MPKRYVALIDYIVNGLSTSNINRSNKFVITAELTTGREIHSRT